MHGILPVNESVHDYTAAPGYVMTRYLIFISLTAVKSTHVL